MAALLAWLSVMLPAAHAQSRTKQASDSPTYAGTVKPARELMDESRDLFLRGLLPLTDYLEHLGLAYDAQAKHVADVLHRAVQSRAGYEANHPPQIDGKTLEKAYRPVYQARLAALEEAVARLEEFRQPAAKGWEADVALAHLALRQAQLETARLLGRRGAVVSLSEAEQQLAAEHYWKRVDDARVGLASLPALVQAVSMLNIAPEMRRNFLAQVTDQTLVWEALGAGIGRRDRATRAELDLSWLNDFRRDSEGSLKVNDAAWRESDRIAQTLFEQQAEFYPKGTATLANLSRSWQVRQQLFELAVEGQYKLPDSSRQQHRRNLNSLSKAAEATTDLRGRHAADVSFVQLLASLSTAEEIP